MAAVKLLDIARDKPAWAELRFERQVPRMKQQILVVDDEPGIRDLLQVYFRKQGYDVTTSGSSSEALALLEEVAIKLILLDVMLGEESDGLKLLETIKRSHPGLPVIIMTGMGLDEELLQEALQKGASSYISKTVPLDRLLAEVRQVLNA